MRIDTHHILLGMLNIEIIIDVHRSFMSGVHDVRQRLLLAHDKVVIPTVSAEKDLFSLCIVASDVPNCSAEPWSWKSLRYVAYSSGVVREAIFVKFAFFQRSRHVCSR